MRRIFSRGAIWIVRVAVVGALLWGLAAVGHLEVGEPAKTGVLRLAWRMAGTQAQICTERDEEELAALPQHMRVPRSCRSVVIPYRLRLWLDGELRLDRVLRPRGAKGDRPIYVQEDLTLTPGDHRAQLSFAPDEDAISQAALNALDEEEAKELEELLEARPRPRFEGTVTGEPGRIVLLEWDQAEQKFVRRGS